MVKVILASSSLGRKKMLSYLNVPFNIISSTVDEEKIIGKNPLDTLSLRARLKAKDVAHKLTTSDQRLKTKDYLIFSADSGAILDNRLIGKPKDHADAIRTLTLLSGRTHHFVTAINIVKLQNNISRTVLETSNTSLVTFRKITSKEIEFYLSVTDYTRYAASYALVSAQDFITEVKGSTSNIIGLPLEIVIPVLNKYNVFRKN